MGKAGIDNKVFGAHSTRAAVTSAAHKNGVSIDRILAAGGWSNENTFGRFYKKPISATQTSGPSLGIISSSITD